MLIHLPFLLSFNVTSCGEFNRTSLVNVPRLIAAKHNTDTVIAEIIVITVKENAFFFIRYIIGAVNITSLTLTVSLSHFLIALKLKKQYF